ncbi:MAG: hypothetical protein P8M30_02405 [Planctomycetaceae bacterium]|jgi:hypothetical protein|nr:hypothetical protein [bacterium]MDB4679514.1 hypothetical protein [Planctomycetaceae bacterium]MDG2388148.1 hypothetical protein [Planctomycetaceae bacterium]
MLPRFGLLCVCLVMALTGALVASSSDSVSEHKFTEIQGPVWIDHGLGAFRAEILEFRELRQSDRAVSISDKPRYLLKLRMIEKNNSPIPLRTPMKIVTLAVGADLEYLKVKDQQKITLMYTSVHGMLKSLFYLGC